MSVFRTTFFLLASMMLSGTVLAQAEPESGPELEIQAEPRTPPSPDVLTKEQWQQVDVAVTRGLGWIAEQQQPDGSFEAIDQAQPAVTSFCLMAFLARGESPVDGKYQQQLAQAIDFIADQQQPNGLIATVAPSAVPIPRDEFSSESLQPDPKPNHVGVTAMYNHAISALGLCEAYGQCTPEQSEALAPVIEKAIAATLEMQRWKGKSKRNAGGWRYVTRHGSGDADLSVTGWHLMFLRSARDAGFEVPKESIDAAVKYVENCFSKKESRQVHVYAPGWNHAVTRAMAGAGILALAHAGKHNSPEAFASGEWILKHDFKAYDQEIVLYGASWQGNRYHYGAVLCTQGMYQLGGKYWNQFFPELVETFLANQQEDGAWKTEGKDEAYGTCYSTSLSVLSLSVPDQMLPIFQR